MLTSNLWVSAGLVNGSLGQVVDIFYKSQHHNKVNFQKYIGPTWDTNNPTFLPVPPIQRGGRTQIPLKMAWALTIHKSQGMTLPKATIDISTMERQGLTFTALSRVPSLKDLHISPAFSYDHSKRMQDNPHVNVRKNAETLLQSLELP